MIKVGFVVPKSEHLNRGIGVYAKNLIEEFKKRTDIETIESADPNTIKTVDLIHYPFFDLFYPTLPLRKRYPTIVTIHDVTPLLFPQAYPPGFKGKINFHRQKLFLKGVDAIITDSKVSKNDINHFLNINLSKIFPINLAPNPEYKRISDKESLNKIRNKYNLPENYAIFIGNVNFNKNIVRMAEACLTANLDLVLIGSSFDKKDNLDHPELRSFKEFLSKFSQNPKIHILGFVQTEETILIANLASVLLLPSLYEGFGLPILEAQACGVPVITSNTSSMPEIAGDGAILVDPLRVDQITEAVKNIISNKSLRNDLIKKGFENIKRFSWQKTASETIEIYKKVITQR